MPGSIRVSVLEAFDLPETCADGESVSVKVSLGTTEYQTLPCIVTHGKTPPWNVDFEFPLLNLRDKLVLVLISDTGTPISSNEMDTSSIVERGQFNTDLILDSGGKISSILSFQLSDEERKRIEVMRAEALKRRQDSLKRTNSKTDESQRNGLAEGVDSGQSINSENGKIHSGDDSVTGEELSPASVRAKIKAFGGSVPLMKSTVIDKLESPHAKQNKKDKHLNSTEASGRRKRPKSSSKPIKDAKNPTTDVKREMSDADNKNTESKGRSVFGISMQVLGGLVVVAAGVVIWAISSDKIMNAKRTKMRKLTGQKRWA